MTAPDASDCELIHMDNVIDGRIKRQSVYHTETSLIIVSER